MVIGTEYACISGLSDEFVLPAQKAFQGLDSKLTQIGHGMLNAHLETEEGFGKRFNGIKPHHKMPTFAKS